MNNQELRSIIRKNLTHSVNKRMENLNKHPEFDMYDMLVSEYNAMLKAIDRVILIEKTEIKTSK